MAEITAMRNNALPFPIYGAPFTIVFPWRDADGDLIDVSGGTPDSEISKNGDTFGDCTNEATQIATTSGVFFLTLTAAELTCDVAAIMAKSGTAGAKTPVATLYPRKLVTIRSGTAASAGSATSTIVLDASASAVDDFYNGMVCVATIDTLVEVRVISDYVGSSKTATVVPDWNVAPDSDDTFVIKLPEGVQINQANTTAWNGTAVASPHTAGYPAVTVKDGTGTGEIDTTSGGVLVSAFAADSITSTALNANAVTEIATAVNTEVVDALNVDTYAEPAQGNPPATTTLQYKVGFLYKLARNKITQTATEFAVYADDGSTKDHEAIVSDDATTFTRGELSTGA